MSDEGEGDKDLDELRKHSLQNIDRKIVENGTTRDRINVVENGRSLSDRVGPEIEDNGDERVVQHSQLSQGVSVCWERFLHVGSVRVLLVENDDSTRHVVGALLRNCSYEVVEASNGLQAWKILEDIANRIDLILTEVVMPCCSGIALLCKIMSHKTRKNVPVIMMSSHDSMGLVFKCLSKGAVDFLVKPIRKNELKNLWQHVWRRCHSSSGSGSESGTQTQKSVRSKSAEKSGNDSGSNDDEDNGSPALNFGDGSDHGSGTQSSWTKHPVEDQVDSFQLLSNLNEVPECPDSTCAQVIIPNIKLSATKDCEEQKEQPENIELENILDTAMLKNSDEQAKFSGQVPTELTSVNQQSAPKVDSSLYSGPTDNSMRGFIERKGSTMSAIAINFSKKQEINDIETDESRDFPSTEQGLKRLRDGQDVEKVVHDERNVLRRSQSSAFSRYNASTLNKVVDTQGTTPNKNVIEKKIELGPNIQSHSGSNAINRCSDGIDLISTLHNSLPASNNNTTENPSTKCLSSFQKTEINRTSSSKEVMLESVTPVKTVVPLVCERQVNPVKCQLVASNHDDLRMKKLSEHVPHCSSSTILGGHLEGNGGNYSVNGSGSGSNFGSNGQNGSSSGANVGIMNMESDNGVGHKNGNGNASASGSGSGSGSQNVSGNGSGRKVDENKLALREAALTKFRQKRKERCFKRKVRYQSRKRLAEQRPRVRGQFVRQAPSESSGKDTES